MSMKHSCVPIILIQKNFKTSVQDASHDEQPKDVYSQLDAYAYGQRLSKQREQKGLSISDVSGQLKLSAVQIAALESGDYQSLPELVYVRGFYVNIVLFWA